MALMLKLVLHRHSWGFLRFQYHEKSPFSRLLQECDTRIKERAAELMEQIRSMSKDPTDILQTMNLVDSIQLLGLDYRFEKEISEALNHIYDAHIDDHVSPGNMFISLSSWICMFCPDNCVFTLSYGQNLDFVGTIYSIQLGNTISTRIKDIVLMIKEWKYFSADIKKML